MNNEIEEIVESMMYLQEQIESKEKELLNLRVMYYKYKEYLMNKYNDEDVDALVYTTKQKILRRNE